MREDDRLPSDLQRAVDLLREEPSVRAEWIESMIETASADRIAAVQSASRDDRWSIAPWMAVVAGLVCMSIGAAGSYVALEHKQFRTTPAAMASGQAAPVRFSLIAPGAVHVQLVGDFNAWDPVALPMRQTRDGSTWEVQVGLPPGRYTYAFVVDGRLARDPSAAQSPGDDFGIPSSVLLVKGGGT